MKKLFVALIMIPVVAWATPAEQCAIEYRVAQDVMELRQQNAPMPEIVAEANAVQDISQRLMVLAILYKAYDQPSWSMPGARSNTVKRFANEIYMACIKRSVK